MNTIPAFLALIAVGAVTDYVTLKNRAFELVKTAEVPTQDVLHPKARNYPPVIKSVKDLFGSIGLTKPYPVAVTLQVTYGEGSDGKCSYYVQRQGALDLYGWTEPTRTVDYSRLPGYSLLPSSDCR